MKTEILVSMLATGVDSVERGAARRRLASAIGWGALGAVLLMAIMLGVRSDLWQSLALPMFWVKLAFPAALVAGSTVAVLRLSRPGARLGGLPAGLVAPVLALWALAALALLDAEPGERSTLVFGETWAVCPLNIAILSAPVFVATLWAVHGLAPTRLRLAGAAAGLLAGSVGALVYALHCPEMAAPFLAVWYVLGISVPVLAGALLAPRCCARAAPCDAAPRLAAHCAGPIAP
jgi:hypothetical protein